MKVGGVCNVLMVRSEWRRRIKFFIGSNSLMAFVFMKVYLRCDVTTIRNFAKMIK